MACLSAVTRTFCPFICNKNLILLSLCGAPLRSADDLNILVALSLSLEGELWKDSQSLLLAFFPASPPGFRTMWANETRCDNPKQAHHSQLLLTGLPTDTHGYMPQDTQPFHRRRSTFNKSLNKCLSTSK